MAELHLISLPLPYRLSHHRRLRYGVSNQKMTASKEVLILINPWAWVYYLTSPGLSGFIFIWVKVHLKDAWVHFNLVLISSQDAIAWLSSFTSIAQNIRRGLSCDWVRSSVWKVLMQRGRSRIIMGWDWLKGLGIRRKKRNKSSLEFYLGMKFWSFILTS